MTRRTIVSVATASGALGAVVLLMLSGATVVTPPRPSGGGGGGGGLVVTETVQATMVDASTITLTHAAVPLGGADLIFPEVFALRTGSDNAVKAVGGGDWVSFVPENLGSGLTWTKDSAAKGHLNANPGKLRPGCKIYLVDTNFRNLVSVGADPTAFEAIEVTADLDTGAVSYIYCLDNSSGLTLFNAAGVYPDGEWYEATLAGFYGQETAMWDNIDSWKVATAMPAGALGKMALSPDGGATWYYHDGTGWVETAAPFPDWDTEGCVVHATIDQWTLENIRDSVNTDISAADWNVFRAMVTGRLDLKVALKTTNSAVVPYIAGLQLQYDEADTREFLPRITSLSGMNSGYLARRVSTTQMLFGIHAGFGAGPWTDYHFRVMTAAP